MPVSPPVPHGSHNTRTPRLLRLLPSTGLSARFSGDAPTRSCAPARGGDRTVADPTAGSWDVKRHDGLCGRQVVEALTVTPGPVAGTRKRLGGGQGPLPRFGDARASRSNIDAGELRWSAGSATGANGGVAGTATAGDHGEWPPDVERHPVHPGGIASEITVRRAVRELRPDTTSKATRRTNPRTRSKATTNPNDDLTTTIKTTPTTTRTRRSRPTQGPRSNQPHEAQTFAGTRSGYLQPPNRHPALRRRAGSAAAVRKARS